MTTHKLFSASLTLASALALAGCPQDNDAMTSEDYDDVAVAVGSLVANSSGGELGSIEDSLGLVEGSGTSAKSVDGSGAHEIYVRAGLTYEYLADCQDAAGNSLTPCDETTDSAAVSVSWSGDLDLPNYEASITRTGEWTLTGLQSETAELNGSGSFAVESHFEALYRPVTKDLVVNYNATYEAVTIDTATKRATGGNITYEISGSRNVQRGESSRDGEFDATAEVSFDDAGNAILVIDGSRTYNVDVNTGDVTEAE